MVLWLFVRGIIKGFWPLMEIYDDKRQFNLFKNHYICFSKQKLADENNIWPKRYSLLYLQILL